MQAKNHALVVKLSDRGLRVGESHGRARYTDAEVERMRQLREEGWTFSRIGKKFGCTRMHAYRICTFRQRATTPARIRVVTLVRVD